MSDMSRPPAPLTAGHARHDELLVAQFAMGDPLPEGRRTEAQGLLATCAACVALAADVRTLAGSVAREPVPPRRRDFRLDAGQSERLHGNPLSRFLRRLSVPRSPAFGPVAAGVFSVGLAFVVVGYAWPEGGAQDRPAAPLSTPALVETNDASPALTQDVAPAMDELTMEADEGVAREQDDAYVSGVESVVGGSAEEAPERDSAQTKSRAPAGPADAADAAEMAEEPEAGASVADSERMVGVDGPSVAASAVAADDVAQSADGTVSADVDGGARSDGPAVEAWLMAVGVGLAMLGALLLLLAVLARRMADPLLR